LGRQENVHYPDTHRLIPAKYSREESVLEKLPLPERVLSDLNELDVATNSRKMAESGRNLLGIGPHELVYGISEAHIINAAFTHPGPYGNSFNSSVRGAWYAGVEFETSVAEVAFHRRRFLRNVRDERFHGRLSFDYADFLADFFGNFDQLDREERKSCLKPEPVPACYEASQALAEKLLLAGSAGIVYPSVRRVSGTCIACFRPVLVSHLRRDYEYRITVGSEADEVVAERTRKAN
jgi:hypothetical protein